MPPGDFEEKTEAPTPRRRMEARERGQVAKSADLTAAGALLISMLVLNFFAPAIMKNLLNLTRYMLGYAGSDALSSDSLWGMSSFAIQILAKSVIPISLILMGIAIAITLAQVGFIFSGHPLKPDLDKINPISGFGKLFSIQSLVRLLISMFKVALIGVVAYFTIKSHMPVIVNLSGEDYWHITVIMGELMFTLGVRLALILLVLGIADYAYNRHKHEQGLRMSKQELKEELRRMEGDPLVKERRRRVAQQLAMQRIQSAVPGSDVVVTNPTHYAVAIKYDPQTMVAPKVVAKGVDMVAQRIRQIAVENGVPIVQRKPLARALYSSVEVGQEIPPAFYKAVAEILAYVYEISGKANQYREQPA